MIAHRWPGARYDGSGGYVTVHARLRPRQWLAAPAAPAIIAAGS
jgi:hypothetical protein